MSAGASITAVVPVHNRADLLAQLLDSIAAQTIPFARVIVVDNASTDAAPALAASRGCTVLTQSTNTGFARAVNIGWREARESEWIAILNSDVTLDPHWAERLRDAAANSSFATGTIFNARDRQSIDGTYDLLSRSGCAWRAGYGERPSAAHAARSSPIALAPGTACLFRRGVLEKLNGFDESFESYLEDVDLGLRCVREGYSGVYVPDAIAWHHGGATLGRWNARVVRLTSRNQLLLVRRHYDRELFRRCLWPIVAGQLLWGLIALRHGAPFAWLAGKWDALRNFRLEGATSPRLRAFLAASEKEIQARAADAYWRWYFRLTSSPGAAH
ncbi:MAG TPA: glycosyltransferase family 2 protein [Bryobacteraceae bacterium]|nr:glycosyltransferase family 2 protein [Bryobacteraceae bacterium]